MITCREKWNKSPEQVPEDGSTCVVLAGADHCYHVATYAVYCRGANGRFTNHGWFVETLGEHGTWIYGEVFWLPPLPPAPRELEDERLRLGQPF